MSSSGFGPPDAKWVVNAAANVYARYGATSNGTTYVQLVASTGATILVTHIFLVDPTSGTRGPYVLDLATGGVGSETIIATVEAGLNTSGDFQRAGIVYALPYPIRVNAGTRLAMKLDQADTASRFGVLYVNESAVVQ